ncbi:hypothetical protein RHGRI_030996 [Rhododendron griersonianum]|uniref:Bulb-type lectin domain-containing protein n=1 Tax=Rhododendron griersonianum TaxID=479676 RepID=A0AAV6I684_9ERIC|nr:hypothetical protein RHGRI_030996 [Rhododendron griersonianum]
MSHGFKQYISTPLETIIIINSGDRLWYVKIEDNKLTEGWDKIVHAHNIQDNFIILFGCVGYLQFNLSVFNTEECEIKYRWSSALPIHQLNAPIGWDVEIAMHNANDCMTCSIKPIIAKIHFPIYSSTESLLIFYIYQCSCDTNCLFTALVSSFRPFCEMCYTSCGQHALRRERILFLLCRCGPFLKIEGARAPVASAQKYRVAT